MKTLKTLMISLMAIAAVVTFNSCGKDTPDAPTISLSENSITLDYLIVDEVPTLDTKTAAFDATIKADGKIETVKVVKEAVFADGSTTLTPPTVGDCKNQTSYTFNYSESYAITDWTIDSKEVVFFRITITVTDKEKSNDPVSKYVTIRKAEGTHSQTELTAWSSEIKVGQKDLSWGSIDKTTAQPYGFEYLTNPTSSKFRIGAYNGAQFVDVSASGAELTTVEDLDAAFTAGTKVDKFDIGFDEGKAFSQMYFISKVGSSYYLIKTTGAHHITSGTGSYIAFVEKH